MVNLHVKSRQQSAHRMIQRWGGMGYLVRATVQRAVTMARMDYTPKANGVALDKVSRIRISVIGLSTPPDAELDEIIFQGEKYRITSEPTGPSPGNDFVFYDCEVAMIGTVP